MSKRLYVCPLPTTAQRRRSQGQETQRNIASSGLLGQDESAVESISTAPSGTQIDGQYRGQYADLMAAELRELSESSGYETVPYYDTDGKNAADGYYSIEQLDIQPTTPNTRLVQQYQGRISKSGSRASHYRAVECQRRQVDHPFGNDTTREIGIPAEATDVHWVNPETGEATAANLATTRSAELGDVTIVDAETAPVQEPTLVYDAPYDVEGSVDVRVWDTRGYTDRDDADGLPQWQKVFVSTHDFEGDAVAISTGLLRVRLDGASDPGISVEQWDDANSTWTSVSLGASSWQLDGVDIGHRTDQSLSPARVDALTRWTDGSSTYSLDMSLQRGHEAVLVDRVPSAATGIPAGLEDLLAPIASASLLDARPSQTLRPRSEVTI